MRIGSDSTRTIPQQRSSPLFPYTTLFRSGREAIALGVAIDVRRTDRLWLPDDQAEQAATLRQVADSVTRRLGDRKSTRLNSSHITISYAVFCLKKKITRVILRNSSYGRRS